MMDQAQIEAQNDAVSIFDVFSDDDWSDDAGEQIARFIEDSVNPIMTFDAFCDLCQIESRTTRKAGVVFMNEWCRCASLDTDWIELIASI